MADNRALPGGCVPQRVGGRRCCDAFLGVSLDEIASGADLGGSSNYSTANVED